VDRLELGVRDGRLGQCQDVVAAHEGDQVVHRRQHPARVRRDELGGVRGVSADPVPGLAVFEVASGPLTDTSAATRNVTVAALDYRAVREQGNRR
jgi:hypothetical protein